MIQDYEITAWLGIAANDLTQEQRAEFDATIRAWDREHPNADPEESAAAWIAALDVAMGSLDLESLAADDRKAQAAALEARAKLRQGVLAALAGMTEMEICRRTGITRPTIRAWAAKS